MVLDSDLSRKSSVVLVSYAIAMLHAARFQWQFHFAAWCVKPIGLLLLLLAMSSYFRMRPSRYQAAAVFVLLTLASLTTEVALRFTGLGEPAELVILELLAAIGLSSLFVAGPIPQRIASAVAVFLAAFLYFVDYSWTTAVMGSCFVAFLIGGMARHYWSKISQNRIHNQPSIRRQHPRWYPLGFSLLPLLLLGWGSLQIPSVARLQSRYSPFSGGDSLADAYAMSGIGDGEALVAATENAQTEGPVDSELFIESQKRSLYDIVSDEYGEARKPKPTQEMNYAVSVAAEKMQKNHSRLAQAHNNSATFSLNRTRARGKRKTPSDLESSALFLVDRQGPMVVKLRTFDWFDGNQWSHGPGPRSQTMHAVVPTTENDWFCLKRSPESQTLRGLSSFTISIIHLVSNDVPTPPLLEAWSIRQVNRPDLYRVQQDQLSMNLGNTIPEFVQIHLVCHGFVKPSYLSCSHVSQVSAQTEINDSGADMFQTVARDLVTEVPALSWQRVRLIQQFLRENFRLVSRDAAIESVTKEPTASALQEFWDRRVGDDFHFATSACVMLREAGIHCRLAQGFYVSPDSFDAKSKKSAVVARDTHTWVEIETEPGIWVPAEFTPGYLEMPEAKNWRDHLVSAALSCASWAKTHPWQVVSLLALLFTVWIFRRRLNQQCSWIWWSILITLFPSRCVHWTWNWTQQVVPRTDRPNDAEPPAEWIRRLTAQRSEAVEQGRQFASLLNSELYAVQLTSRTTLRQQLQCCRDWVRHWRRTSPLTLPPTV